METLTPNFKYLTLDLQVEDFSPYCPSPTEFPRTSYIQMSTSNKAPKYQIWSSFSVRFN